MPMIEVEVKGLDSDSVKTGFVDETSICQNLIVPS